MVTPAFQMLCCSVIRGRKNKKCLKKASDTLKHETEITKGDWDTDRVSVAQEWQFGKFELCLFLTYDGNRTVSPVYSIVGPLLAFFFNVILCLSLQQTHTTWDRCP